MHSYLLVATLVTLAGMDPVPARGGPNFLARARGGARSFSPSEGGERERGRRQAATAATHADRQTERYKI